jgi:flagellar biosynthesis/type III secretory pathway M-ring protein FliF/YscJ
MYWPVKYLTMALWGKVECTLFKKSLAGNLIAAMLIALLVIGGGVVAQVVWPQLLSTGQPQYGAQDRRADDVSLREIQLQRQSQQLIEPFVAAVDFRVTVSINDVRPGSRQVTLLINRPEVDSSLAQRLREILWSGLALNAVRDDKVVVQFHAFAPSHSQGGGVGDQVLAAWRAVVGAAFVSVGLLVLWLWRRQRRRDLLKAQEVSDYQKQLLALKTIAKQEPGRVAGVLSAWLNDDRQ